MDTITTEKFERAYYDTWENMYEYHCTYILENGKEAYVGETNDIKRRAREHNMESLTNYLKPFNFDKIHIISGRDGEGTPAEHYEYLLTRLMSADTLFTVVNKQGVNIPHYNRINDFEKYFDALWPQLVEKNLVSAKEFADVINTSTYKYSPFTVLTDA
ncbi:MAG: GIY-YIG nuclease family protein [Defluviitaleaceae bacterium]|nr:GIY-YIG nuclease family protein [Defluviitaleaceae bacterium]